MCGRGRRLSQIAGVGGLVLAMLPALAAAQQIRYADPGVRGASERLTGTLVEVADGPQRYFVETSDGILRPVDVDGKDLPDSVRDASVEAAVTRDGTVRSATFTPPSPRIAATPTAHRAYVAKVNIAGKGTIPSDAAVGAMVDANLERWRQESNGAITAFTRQALQTLSTTTDCSSGSALWNEAESRNLFPGVSFGGATGNHLIVVGAPDCAGGLGTVGSVANGIASGGRLNMSWGAAFNDATLMHELGHNLSLQHANSCKPAAGSCPVDEYGNRYAFMGVSIGRTPQYVQPTLDGFERAKLQITDAGEIVDLALGTGQRTLEGTYDLRARGSFAGLRGLRITDPVSGRVQFVDWRSGGGRDTDSYYATQTATHRFRSGVTLETAATASATSETLQGFARATSDGVVYSLVAGESATVGALTLTVISTGSRTDPAATARVGVRLTDPSVPPDTSITSGPAAGATVRTGSVDLGFAGTPSDAVAGFDCSLDGGGWTACTSPRTLSGLPDGSHTFRVRARDATNLADASPAARQFNVDTTPVPTPTPAPTPTPSATPAPTPAPTSAPGPTPTTTPGPVATPAPSAAPAATAAAAAGSSPVAAAQPFGATALEPAKLELARASVSRTTRRLSVLAPISARASGVVQVVFRAGGRTTRFEAPIDAARRRVVVDREISATQARGGSGLLVLTYPGDADTQPQTVRLRAASAAANLRAGRPTISGGRLRAAGRISPSARGVVRVQVLYEPAAGPTRVLTFRAPLSGGRYAIDAALPADVAGQLLQRRGVVHSYTLFTGDLGRGLRGELASFGVLGRP